MKCGDPQRPDATSRWNTSLSGPQTVHVLMEEILQACLTFVHAMPTPAIQIFLRHLEHDEVKLLVAGIREDRRKLLVNPLRKRAGFWTKTSSLNVKLDWIFAHELSHRRWSCGLGGAPRCSAGALRPWSAASPEPVPAWGHQAPTWPR